MFSRILLILLQGFLPCSSGLLLFSSRIIVQENQPVVSPREPGAVHNFGPVSFRDSTLYTAERPGHSKNEFPPSIVDDWVGFMKSRGIDNVLITMDDNEFDVYAFDLKESYRRGGMNVHHIPFRSPGSYDRIMALIEELEERDEKVVSHCTGGKGRCGRVACAWLCKKWCLTPLEASQEFIDQAVEDNVYRLADVQKLKKWIGYGSC